MESWDQVKKLDAELYKLLKEAPKHYTYGTAGFRYNEKPMEAISFRVGLFMDYLAKYYYPDALGIVISASHNPKEDNGLKLINPEGEMLDSKYEQTLDDLVNTEDLDKACEEMRKSVDSLIEGKNRADKGLIFIGQDTRRSSPILHKHLTAFASSKFIDFGELSTPILYFLVAKYNSDKEKFSNFETLHEEYFNLLKSGFDYNMKHHYKKKRFNLVWDCANGVGAKMMHYYKDCELFKKYNPTFIYNSDFDNLNVKCGADWVHKYQKATQGFLNVPESDDYYNLCFVFDGDADRSIFYIRAEKGSDKILVGDGSRISVLFARVLAHFKKQIVLRKEEFDPELVEKMSKAKVGLVYTAYNNSAYTDYVRDTLKLETEIAKTGVKYLHEKAKHFDIGLYFESNGHGTIIYKHKTIEFLESLASSAKTEEAGQTVKDFINYLVAQNNINGDAMSNFLQVLSAFEILDICPEELLNCYTDKLSRISTVKLKDRTLMQSTTDDERVLAEPADLQGKIDEILAEYPGYFGFARPSGTEDLCRIYLEGKDEEKLKELEKKLQQVVSQHPKLAV